MFSSNFPASFRTAKRFFPVIKEEVIVIIVFCCDRQIFHVCSSFDLACLGSQAVNWCVQCMHEAGEKIKANIRLPISTPVIAAFRHKIPIQGSVGQSHGALIEIYFRQPLKCRVV